MDYTWKNEDNYRRGMLHAIEVLEAVKNSTGGDEVINTFIIYFILEN